MAELGEPPATSAHRYSSHSKAAFDLGQPRCEVLEAPLLLVLLGMAGVPPHTPAPAANRNVQSPVDHTNRSP
jgi:hypothetical protein